MSSNQPSQLRGLLEESGMGWLFNSDDADERACALASDFQLAELTYNSLYSNQKDFYPLVSSETGQLKYKAFLQSFALPLSTEARVIIFRILDGAVIRNMDFSYTKGSTSRLQIRFSDDEFYILADGAWDVLLIKQLSFFESQNLLEVGSISPWENLATPNFNEDVK